MSNPTRDEIERIRADCQGPLGVYELAPHKVIPSLLSALDEREKELTAWQARAQLSEEREKKADQEIARLRTALEGLPSKVRIVYLHTHRILHP